MNVWQSFYDHYELATNDIRKHIRHSVEHYKKWGISTPFTSYKGQRALTELFWPLGPSIKIVCLLSPDWLAILPPLKNLLRSGDFFTHVYWENSLWFNVCFNFEMFYLTAENRSLTTRHWIHGDYLTSQVYPKKKTKNNHLPTDPPWEFRVGWQQKYF